MEFIDFAQHAREYIKVAQHAREYRIYIFCTTCKGKCRLPTTSNGIYRFFTARDKMQGNIGIDFAQNARETHIPVTFLTPRSRYIWHRGAWLSRIKSTLIHNSMWHKTRFFSEKDLFGEVRIEKANRKKTALRLPSFWNLFLLLTYRVLVQLNSNWND